MKETKITPEILKKYLKSLFKFERYLETVYVYGSAVAKKAANDIDVMIILNDSGIPPDIETLDLIERECGKIEDLGKKQGLTFHFQPLKMLSRWWYLLLEGEPWIVSSLDYTMIIYDKKSLISQVSNLIKDQAIYKKEEKAEKMIERSCSYTIKNRQLLLTSLNSLSNAATEAAQILLLFDSKLVLNKRKILEDLEKSYSQKIGWEMIGNYREIIDLEEKMEKGALSEFSAENLDYYLEKTKKFIAKIEQMLSAK
jgi:predicted nucleotidyltransferase